MEAVKEAKTEIYTEELQVEKGYLLEVLAYSRSPKRRDEDKNWLAVIEDFDPEAPNGLKRNFLKKGNGKYYYSVKELKPGDVVEFGADTFNRYNKTTDYYRHYAVVLEVADEYLKLATSDNWIAKSKSKSIKVVNEAFEYAKEIKNNTDQDKSKIVKEIKQQIDDILSTLSYERLLEVKDSILDRLKNITKNEVEVKWSTKKQYWNSLKGKQGF